MPYIAWEGPSELDGNPIVVLVTGLDTPSKNRKTGPMAQTWILRSDVPPVEAVKTGADFSICGHCKLRGDGTGKQRSCYVLLFQAPSRLFKLFKQGTCKPLDSRAFFHRGFRLGAYGDHAAIPTSVTAELVARSSFHTGYTHQWRTCDQALKRYLMASCESQADREQAKSMGWSTFRTVTDNLKHPGETLCPASIEAGAKLDCFSCRKCAGEGSRDVFILPHGVGKKHLLALAGGAT